MICLWYMKSFPLSLEIFNRLVVVVSIRKKDKLDAMQRIIRHE